MTHAAPRIRRSLVRTLERADDGARPIAEVNRRVGAAAERLGLPRPSYEQVRVLVHAARRRRAEARATRILVDVTVSARRRRWWHAITRPRRPVDLPGRLHVTVCYESAPRRPPPRRN